jgi:tetratricopeptide (TPR) repeat protein
MAPMRALIALALLATQDPAVSSPEKAAPSAPVTSAATATATPTASPSTSTSPSTSPNPSPSPTASPSTSPSPPPAATTPTAVANPSAAPAATPAATPAPLPVAVRPPSPAFLDKLSYADRLFVAGDFRNALFAYQDAVYLDPSDARARVRLGRAYAAMRYPAQAHAQYEKALELDPAFGEARRAMEELRTPPATPAAVAAPAKATPVVIPAAPVEKVAPAPAVSAEPHTQVRVYKLPVEADEPPPRREAAAAEAQPPDAPSPAQRYRAALDHMAKREFARAVTELDDAIAQDPRLAVAYVARASAQFGLARYREASDDYKAALGLDPSMATPLYGLAECQRLLGDGGAAELYGRYAESRAPDVREDLRALAKKRATELRKR